MTDPCLVRDANEDDLAAVQAIYAHHVMHGLASFEEQAPDRAELVRRWQEVTERDLPYVVAEVGGEVLAYAYAGPYRARPAYRFSVENSVYVAPGAEGRGLGGALLEALIERCAALGVRQMVAIIGDSGNQVSIRLHERLGFRSVGVLRAVGFKQGRWVDTVVMQRAIAEGDQTLP